MCNTIFTGKGPGREGNAEISYFPFLSFLLMRYFLLPVILFFFFNASAQKKKSTVASAAVAADSLIFSKTKYRLVGPFRGGRSAAVAGSYKNKNIFYFGATGGGVWKTQDGITGVRCLVFFLLCHRL